MRSLVALVGSAVAMGAFVVVPAGATVQQSTGDTCVASGNGTSYALTLTLPSTAPPQYGFAFGVAGATVTNVVIAGSQGTFSTQSLPATSSGSWITLTALMPGSVVADVTTTHAVTGSFTVTPASASTPAYFTSISCAVARAAIPSSAFTVDPRVAYVTASHSWRLGVTIAGAGVVSAVEPEPSHGTAGSAQVTAMPLVQTIKRGLKSAGKVTLSLRLTSRGQKMIATSGSLRVKLEVVFNPKDGKTASKIVSLVLKKT